MSGINNPWFGVSMALIGVIVGYVVAVSSGNSPFVAAPAPSDKPTAAAPAPTPAPNEDLPAITADDYVRGNPEAEISLIEYSDFECPFCKRHHPTMTSILEEYDGKVNWVYRHYPLSFHPNATPAAEASECAGQLGGNDAFWSFTDDLFTKGVEASSYLGYAEAAGVDGAAFTDCVEAGTYAQKVKDQFTTGGAAGVRGTPGTFVLNNKTGKTSYVSGAQPASSFNTAIEALLK